MGLDFMSETTTWLLLFLLDAASQLCRVFLSVPSSLSLLCGAWLDVSLSFKVSNPLPMLLSMVLILFLTNHRGFVHSEAATSSSGETPSADGNRNLPP